jgi:hypothetical protein
MKRVEEEAFVPMADEDKPIHKFSGCNCFADPVEHCNAMMPDNTFCCAHGDAICHKPNRRPSMNPSVSAPNAGDDHHE